MAPQFLYKIRKCYLLINTLNQESDRFSLEGLAQVGKKQIIVLNRFFFLLLHVKSLFTFLIGL